MAHEELVFMFANNQPVDLGHALPMDVPQRIAGAIIAQPDELVGLAHGGSQSYTGRLVFARAWQCDARKNVPLWQNQQRLWQWHTPMAAHQSEDIGAGEGRTGEMNAAAPPGGELDAQFNLVEGRYIRHGLFLDHRRLPSGHQP